MDGRAGKIKRARNIFIFVNCGLILSALVYALVFHLASSGATDILSKPCYIQKTLGIYCPGCGGTRAVYALVQFKIAEAFWMYPPLFAAILAVLCYDARVMRALLTKNISYLENYRYYIFILIPIAVILNFLLNNALLFFGIDRLGDIL